MDVASNLDLNKSLRNRRFSTPASSRSISCSGDDALNKLLAAAEACEIIEEMEVTEGAPPTKTSRPESRKKRQHSASSCYTPRSDDRKLLHKLSEQKRRDTLKDRLEALKELVPGLRAETKRNDTIQTVLSKSVEYIHFLEDSSNDFHMVEEHIQRVEMYNQELALEIERLREEERALCVI